MKATCLLLMGFAVSALGGCRNQSTDGQPAPVASTTVELTDEAVDQSSIPVKEDFEDQARQSITDDNLDEQVGQLEREIEGDR